jgi:SEC-C motif-containing protein
MKECPCGSGLSYSECCEPVIKGTRDAATAEQLMRSRYSAYARAEVEYLRESLHPDHRNDYDPKSTKQWAESSQWEKFEIIGTEAGGPEDDEGTVEFTATFVQDGAKKVHRERASFRKVDGRWFFENGEALVPKPVVRDAPKIGRNEPCPCGSGKKYKKCCGAPSRTS